MKTKVNNKMKYCIFHIPNYIDKSAISGSSLRPRKMLEAFQKQGYHVDYVMGYGSERKKQIAKIKLNIKNGVQYDFMYAESSTMPTLLTEKDHIPRHPFLDFSFMKFCKKNGIPIGLFYRDIQWKFDFYKKEVPFYKRMISIPLYHYDLRKYSRLLDKFYLPTVQMGKWIGDNKRLHEIQDALMPGGDEIKNIDVHQEQKDGMLRIFYVGGIRNIYDLEEYMKAIDECEFVQAIICCREQEWELEKERYSKYLSERIQIVHASGNELNQYYQWADLCAVFIGNEEYAKMAMSIKIFEYLANGCPIIATEGTASGDFVKETGIGWSIKCDYQSLKECLEVLHTSPQLIEQRRQTIEMIQNQHTWVARAKKVIEDMKKIQKEC